ncbi:E3 SUMO-protein ligase ZBED1-like [Anoplolepis gracilipes]|uniref:E3 SUMO-protein ligase ZBED1-like n=1 Tax=Anoplolepis gracilipes TaxID=354296 RepID=UPI003BA2588A
MHLLEPGYKVPCAQTIRTRLQFLYDKIKKELINNLSKVYSVSLSIDGWSSRMQNSYISVEAQYLDEECQLHRVTLCNLLLEGRATAKKYFRNCALCIKDTLNDVSDYEEICTKGRVITAHKSNVASQALTQRQIQLNQKEEHLTQSCETRWNSKLHMCESLLRNRKAISFVLADTHLTSNETAQKLEIIAAEWTIMDEMVKILKSFQVATTLFCSESNITLLTVRPIIMSIMEKHMLILPTDSENLKKFKIAAYSSLKRRFNIKDIQLEPISATQIATFLDPRYKSLDLESTEVKSDIIAHIKSLHSDKFPTLFKLAIQYLSIPAASERTFSTATLLHQKEVACYQKM